VAEEEGRPFSESLYQQRLAQKTAGVMQNLEQVAMWPAEAYMRSRVFQALGDSPQTRNALSDVQAGDVAGMFSLYEQTLLQHGQTQSDAGKKLGDLQTKYDKLLADHQRLIGADVKGSGASTTGRASDGGSLTYDQILKMSPKDIAAIPDDVFLKATGG
jgi:hypothetical protein